jgi:hypothetical protein
VKTDIPTRHTRRLLDRGNSRPRRIPLLRYLILIHPKDIPLKSRPLLPRCFRRWSLRPRHLRLSLMIHRFMNLLECMSCELCQWLFILQCPWNSNKLHCLFSDTLIHDVSKH